MMSQMSRDSGMSMNSLQTGYSGDTGSLPSSLMGAHNDWEIAPMDIEILRREDGSPWELGAGAFGKVTPVLRKQSRGMLPCTRMPAAPCCIVVASLELGAGAFGIEMTAQEPYVARE